MHHRARDASNGANQGRYRNLVHGLNSQYVPRSALKLAYTLDAIDYPTHYKTVSNNKISKYRDFLLSLVGGDLDCLPIETDERVAESASHHQPSDLARAQSFSRYSRSRPTCSRSFTT